MLFMYYFLLYFILPAHTFFSKHFADFLEENYGSNFRNLLQRSDLGNTGSFGGKTNENDTIVNDPVIFVHGVSDVAGLKMQAVASHYRAFGYTDGELYSTSYGYGAKLNPLQWTLYSMKCEHVKQIRALILAVRYYARQNVDIVAFSLGVPLSRKAILGGRCVDTNEDLGGPLTPYIETFLGIAGPNHGITLKVAGLTVPACALGTLPICDRVVGLYSGLCPLESEFLNDINRNHHYEGKVVYTIYSHIDEKIGYKVTSSINGEDDHKSFRNLNHDETLDTTYGLQISMIQGRFGGRTQNGVGETNSTDSDVKQIDSLNNVSIHNETISLDEGGGLNVSNIEVQQKTDVTQSSKLEKEEYDDSQLNNIDKIRRFFHEQKYDLLNDDRITSFSSVDSSNNEVGPLFTDENTKKPNSSNNTDNVGTSGYHTRISFRID
ncbi:hypothetical protein RB195_021899 [Necator americanus]|uniref:Triacylglycerol lipase n=1 Tax=Necator americanus TaxID=51031 RepID=A0ABR1ED41_NECAM